MSLMKSMKKPSKTEKKSIPLSKVYQLIEPGPVLMVTTSFQGKDNVMSMSWHMMVDFEPPLLACVISENNYTFELLRKTRQCVLNIPTVELVKKVIAVGNIHGKDVDKFEKFNLEKSPASSGKAPLLAEAFANLECKVTDMKLAKKYNIFFLEVMKAWAWPKKGKPLTIHHCGYGNFTVDGKLIKIPSKMK